jgi:hypothetical protein
LERTLEELRHQAKGLVRDEWTAAVEILRVRLDLINDGRRDGFCTMGEVVREYIARAGSCSNFAVSLGLITPAEDLKLRQEFRPALSDFLSGHPELAGWDQPCPYLVNRPPD